MSVDMNFYLANVQLNSIIASMPEVFVILSVPSWALGATMFSRVLLVQVIVVVIPICVTTLGATHTPEVSKN
jgi:hypothetical protein